MADTTTRIPAGRYAIVGKDGSTVRMYRVSYGTAGKWKGFRFIVRLRADGGHTFQEDRIADAAHRAAIFAYLTAHTEECAARYGHLTNHCGMCNRVLSDPESIARGIGPICAGKAGW